MNTTKIGHTGTIKRSDVTKFKAAFNAASKSKYKYKIGAVIYRHKKLISSGYNKNKTHPKSNALWRTTHAEFDAIKNARGADLRGCEMYVLRITAHGTGTSKPCDECQYIIKQSGIKTIHYTFLSGHKTQEI